jgi:hypothetical protein
MRTSSPGPPGELATVAVHEAGHALVRAPGPVPVPVSAGTRMSLSAGTLADLPAGPPASRSRP